MPTQTCKEESETTKYSKPSHANFNQVLAGSTKLIEESKQLVQKLKQNKSGDDMFTQKNLDLVTQFLRDRESISAAEKQ